MIAKKIFFIPILVAAFFPLHAQMQWRNDRTGIYNETGLMKSWAASGPEMLWHTDGFGLGYSSVCVVYDKIFVTGCIDEKGYLFVLNREGKLQQKIEYGNEYVRSYPGARSGMMHDDGKLYIVSGMAVLYCYDIQTMRLLWKKDYAQEYAAENTRHGWHGPPLIVGEKLIIAPGGKKHHVVALNKSTGEMIWTAEGAAESDMSGYGVPIFIADQQVPQVAVMMGDHIIGLDVTNGRLLWSYPHTNRFREHPNTPIYHDNMLLCTSAYGKGSVMLRLTNGGRSVSKVWELTEIGHAMGHAMKFGNYIYSSGERMDWHCVDWQTGKIMYSDRTLGVGNIIAADGMLYIYSDRGEMALVKPNHEKFEIVSKFNITLGTEQHWAHPVIYKGILYVRHGDSLMTYKIKQ